MHRFDIIALPSSSTLRNGLFIAPKEKETRQLQTPPYPKQIGVTRLIPERPSLKERESRNSPETAPVFLFPVPLFASRPCRLPYRHGKRVTKTRCAS